MNDFIVCDFPAADRLPGLPRQRRLSHDSDRRTLDSRVHATFSETKSHDTQYWETRQTTKQLVTSDNNRRSPWWWALTLEHAKLDRRENLGPVAIGGTWIPDRSTPVLSFSTALSQPGPFNGLSPGAPKWQQETSSSMDPYADLHALRRTQTNGIPRATSTTFCVCSTPTLTASRRSSTP